MRIGYLAFGGATGGTASPWTSWVEYFNWNDPNATCGQQLASTAQFFPIMGDAGTVPYNSTDTSSTCTYADHNSILSGGVAQLQATP